VTQELLRHASRVTLDTYTQAVTLQKRKAQSNVIRLLRDSAHLLAETHSVLLLFLLCAYANAPGLGEHIGDQTNWVPIHGMNCVFFVPIEKQCLSASL